MTIDARYLHLTVSLEPLRTAVSRIGGSVNVR